MANWLPVTEPFGTSLKVMVYMNFKAGIEVFHFDIEMCAVSWRAEDDIPWFFWSADSQVGYATITYHYHMTICKLSNLSVWNIKIETVRTAYFDTWQEGLQDETTWNYHGLRLLKHRCKKTRWKNPPPAAESAPFNSFSAGKDPGHHQSQRSSLLAHLFDP